MKKFDELSEREILALAISLEEEDETEDVILDTGDGGILAEDESETTRGDPNGG